MRNQLIATLILLAALVLSACQAQPQPLAIAVPTPVKPTSTSQPAAQPTNTRIPFVYPTATATQVVPTEDPGVSVAWTFKTGGAVWGTPAVDNGEAFIGSDDGSLYAVDVKTGQMLWKFDTGGIVRSTPSIAGGLVYIASDDGFAYAVSAKDGKQAWKTDIGNAYPREKREALGNSPDPSGWDYLQSSPVAADGLVYVGSFDGNVYALNAADGKIAWTFKTGDKVRATALVSDGVVYIGSWDLQTYALDAKTGAKRWAALVSGQVQTTALLVDSMVITASRKAAVFALDKANGKTVWEYSYGQNMWVESSPRLSGDQVIIGSSGSNVVNAIDFKTGKLAWMFSSESFNWSTPLPLKDRVFVGGAAFNNPSNGGMFVLKVSDKGMPFNNVRRSIFSVPETLEYSGNISGVAGSPVLVDGMLFFAALDGKLYAVKA